MTKEDTANLEECEAYNERIAESEMKDPWDNSIAGECISPRDQMPTVAQTTIEPMREPPPSAEELPRSVYDIAVVYHCDPASGGCGTKNGIIDPKLVTVTLGGASVNLTCQKCKKEWLITPNPVTFAKKEHQRIVTPGTFNRHQRRSLANARRINPRIIQGR